MRIEWNGDQVAALMTMWAGGEISAGDIARAMSSLFGAYFTKNAVIGKVSRLGIKKGVPIPGRAISAIKALLRKSPFAKDVEVRVLIEEWYNKVTTSPRSARDQDQGTLVEEVEQEPEIDTGRDDASVARRMQERIEDLLPSSKGAHPHLWEIDRGCLYSVGRENGYHVFCGCKRKSGSSYCEVHHVKCWKPLAKRRPRDTPPPRRESFL